MSWLDEIDDTGPSYRCPICGLIGHARVWSWFGAAAPNEEAPPDRECSSCGAHLFDRHEVAGVGCGDCGREIAQDGSDYCAKCDAAHDAAEVADPLHQHVWQSADEFERHVCEITLDQRRVAS